MLLYCFQTLLSTVAFFHLNFCHMYTKHTCFWICCLSDSSSTNVHFLAQFCFLSSKPLKYHAIKKKQMSTKRLKIPHTTRKTQTLQTKLVHSHSFRIHAPPPPPATTHFPPCPLPSPSSPIYRLSLMALLLVSLLRWFRGLRGSLSA